MANISSTNIQQKIKPPDGGWGWIVVAASFMCNFIDFGIASSFGVLLEQLVEYFDSDRSTVSWIGSLMIGMRCLSGPIASMLVRKFGTRAVIISGAIISSISLFLSTISTNVFVLMFTYGIIGGFGLGLISLPAVVIVGYYFESKRALATGVALCGSGVGSFTVPFLANLILIEYGGTWKSVLYMYGLFALCSAFFCLVMKPVNDSDSDYQLPKVNGGNGKLITNSIFLICCFCYVLGSLGQHVPYVFLPNMAHLEAGISKGHSNYLLVIMGISNFLGRIFFGYVSDFNWTNSLVITNLCIATSGIAMIAMPECSSYEAYIVVAIVYGFFISAFISLQSIVVVYLFGIENLTKTFGSLKMVIGMAQILGSPLAGFLYDQTQEYHASFYVAGGLLIFSSMFSSIVYCKKQKITTSQMEQEIV